MAFETVLQSIISSGPAVATFLGNYAVHSTALLGVAWACTGRRSPLPVGVRESVWRGALVLGVATAAAATAFPGLGVLPQALAKRLPDLHKPSAMHVNKQPLTTGGSGLLVDRLARATPALMGGGGLAAIPSVANYDRIAPAPRPEPIIGPVEFRTAEPRTVTTQPPVMHSSMTTDSAPVPWGMWISAGWLALAAAGLARLAWLRLRLSETLGPREPVGSTRISCQFDSLADEIGLTGQVRLTQSRRLSTPIALPTGEVCIPTGILEALPPEQARCILAHELAHVARRDPAWLLGMKAIEAAFWFQPLNRVARRKLQELAEYACDDAAATSTTGGDLAMANSLATAARWLGGETPMLAAAMAAGPSTLVRRVERLLGDAEPKHLTGRARLLLAVPVLAALGVVTLSPSALADEGTRVAPATPPAAPGVPTTPDPADAPAPAAVKHVIVGASATGEAPTAYVLNGGSAAPLALTPLPDKDGYFATLPGGNTVAVATWAGDDGRYVFTPGGKRNVIGVGISPVQGALAAQLGIESGKATVIDEVYDDSEAAKAGLKQFDIITSVEGADASPEAIRKAIAEKKPGESISLGIRRGSQTLTIPVNVREVEGGLFGGSAVAPRAFAFTPGPGTPGFFGGEGLSEEIIEEIRKSMGPGFDPKLEEDLKSALGDDFEKRIDEAVKRAIESSRAAGNGAFYAFGSSQEARADAQRRAEEALARAHRAFPTEPPNFPGEAREEMARALANLARDQARLQEELARLHDARFAEDSMLAGTTGGAASKLRSGYVDIIAKDLVKKLSGKGYTGDLAALEESLKASARAALAATNEVTESISCNNDKCKGTLSVESKSYAEGLIAEILEHHAEVAESVKGGEDVLRAAVKSVCGDNESYKLTWDN